MIINPKNHLHILEPGLWTTIQDSGRRGYQHAGVPVSGALDATALRIANLLVGNPRGAAALEITMAGPSLRFAGDALIALCGGDLGPSINGEAVPGCRPVLVRGGSELRFTGAAHGCRAYLAVAGGVDVALVLGSRSTYVRAALGGLGGRPLQRGDKLPLGTPPAAALALAQALAETHSSAEARAFRAVRWYAALGAAAASGREALVRFVPGREHGRFTADSQRRFAQERYTLTPQSDRMGLRLAGAPLRLEQQEELVSSPVTEGTVQVPADGQPIILMADRQTTGGYPRIAQIAAVDLPKLAQLRPGASVVFQEVSREEAEQLYLQRELELLALETGIQTLIRSSEPISC
ncbi:5-oxoprolinase subunit C family protein [Paenibacillus senegalensis]|uniref:5-oxoprolinase subunit C family protein n=1 Tax=Paenibacillus senegalensis TaxID=1465766 RepID=UPI00028825F9|nr:biotin-dependent carboxyltransferase family protein [Paenibacillus senegalensis]